jgi:hypothetical protein
MRYDLTLFDRARHAMGTRAVDCASDVQAVVAAMK